MSVTRISLFPAIFSTLSKKFLPFEPHYVVVCTCVQFEQELGSSKAPPGWLSGERVGLMTPLRQLFFPAYFRLSPLQKHVRKVVGGFEKKSCVITGV